MADRDIMQIAPGKLSNAEKMTIINAIKDSVARGDMSYADGRKTLLRGGMSAKFLAKHFYVGGAVTKKAKVKSVTYNKGGYSKPHNYFAGGSVTNNLKKK